MFYKRIQAFGDSFTAGTELVDGPVGDQTDDQLHSVYTWPALLAKKWNIDYRSNSLGGIGNQRISFAVIDRYLRSGNLNQSFYIVNWSWFERFDYLDPVENKWNTLHPRHTDQLDHFFYKNLDSDLWNMIRNLQTIHSTIKFLEDNHVDFAMTCLDPIIFTRDRPEVYNGFITQIQNSIHPYFVNFEDLTFLEWSHKHNFECGSGGHPLEQAHAAAVEYIEPYILQRTKTR